MPNRLVGQLSPYLLQHANNPVDWWPWGEPAFAEARRRNVPIFLSIGYSTCYWCHVMERESFENPSIAQHLNSHFVSIKVDREERPDIDDIYMAATLMMTGRGGWPMSVFLEPASLKPFYCGTYYPPISRPGMLGFPDLLDAISRLWNTRKDDVLKQAADVAQAVRDEVGERRQLAPLTDTHITSAVQILLATFDRINGGFGQAPKFPQPSNLEFLLDVRASAGDQATAEAIDQVLSKTLDAMALGGIHDHLAGGFHRYAVDASWTVPHFEKMLYDNALLASTYLRAAAHFRDSFFNHVARRALAYIITDLNTPQGGFASAQDAEVDHREGLNYLWTPDQVRAALDPTDAQFAIQTLGLDAPANFRDPHHPNDPPSWVLRLACRPDPSDQERLHAISQRLLASRRTRPQPATDDKIITSWNGLAIKALAMGSTQLNEPAFLDSAVTAATFILKHMRDATGRLLRVHRSGTSASPPALDDYAFLIAGLLAIQSAAPNTLILNHPPLHHALQLAELLETQFSDNQGGYFDAPPTSPDHPSQHFVRPRSLHDGAIPSGSSFMLHNLLDLAKLTGDPAWNDRAIALARSISGFVAASPQSAVHAVAAIYRILSTIPGAAQTLADAPAPNLPPPDSSVEVYADRDRISVGPDLPAELNLVVRVPPGQHLYAAPAQSNNTSVLPLRVGVHQGTGIAVYADYPAPKPWPVDPSIMIYEGDIELRVAVELDGTWSGRPLLYVSFQSCTNDMCLAPAQVELDVAIDRI
jgi:uncharacterized protein